MAFLVEDGTGLASATSGASVTEADAYFTDRAVTAWTGTTGVKQAALIRATDYIELRFALYFKGTMQFPLTPQALSFPRLDENGITTGIPVAYKRAVFEYAVRALSSVLAPDPTVSASGLSLTSELHTIGPITDSFTYAKAGAGSAPSLFKPYPAADRLLTPLLRGSSGVIR